MFNKKPKPTENKPATEPVEIKSKPTKKSKKVKKVNYKPGEKSSRKNLILIIGAALLTITLAGGIFMTLSTLFSTETYYVLNTNVKAKQLITPQMVTPRETAKGTGPVNALSMTDIQRGQVYSRYPMYAGDVVAKSNAGPSTEISLGIPDDWVVTSFSIVSTDAVGGILGRGDYVDIMGVNEFGAQYIFNNVLVLEVKFVNQELDGKLEGQTVVGEVMHYTIGMPAEYVAYLHSALFDYEVVKVIKSPVQIRYANRDTSNLDDVFKYGPNVGSVDLIEGTDPTFTPIERDETGKPLVTPEYSTPEIENKPNPVTPAPETPVNGAPEDGDTTGDNETIGENTEENAIPENDEPNN